MRYVARCLGCVGFLCLALAMMTACTRVNRQATAENQPVSKAEKANQPAQTETTPSPDPAPDDGLETVTLGAGCFWCVEAVFQQLEGVESVASGYSGGTVENPTYKDVCTGTTGHAEVCQVTFRPEVISFEQLLDVFWKTHDPTTLNRQGADVGTQYRSAVFYHNEKQRALAEGSKKKLDESGILSSPIVTEITPYKNFYRAEDYHHNYFRDNPNQGYCRAVIAPKVEKFQRVFADRLKKQQATEPAMRGTHRGTLRLRVPSVPALSEIGMESAGQRDEALSQVDEFFGQSPGGLECG